MLLNTAISYLIIHNIGEKMKTFGYSFVFVLITICIFSIQPLIAIDTSSSKQPNKISGKLITNFGGGPAITKNTTSFILLSEFGEIIKISKRYSCGYKFHSELDLLDNIRFGFNLLLRRNLKNQKSYDVGAGLIFYQIGDEEKTPTLTTFFNYNFLPDIAFSIRMTILRMEETAYEPVGDIPRIITKGQKLNPVIYFGLLARSKTGRNLNLIAVAAAAVAGLLFLSGNSDN